VKHSIALAIKSLIPHLSYSYWIKHREQRASGPGKIAQGIASFQYTPKVSVLMPVYNTAHDLLDLAIRSVQMQHYENWELCICDDGSTDRSVRTRLASWQQKDHRIKVTSSTKNEGISVASNRALELASGEFVGFLDHDDELSADALYEVVKLLQEHPDSDMIYSDEDKLDPHGRRVTPHFKPDWSPEFMLSFMYTCHFSVYRRSLLEEIGGFRLGFEGGQDYDLVLRIIEKTDRIFHIPRILYHWRMAPGSVASSGESKPYAYDSTKKALTEHLRRRQIPGEIVHGQSRGWYRVRFRLEGTDKVSIVILNVGGPDALIVCVRAIKEKISYDNYELVIVGDRDLSAHTKNYLASQSCRLIASDKASSVSHLLNTGAARALGQYLLFVHADTEVIAADWVSSMLGFCRMEEIGVVGAKLLYRTGRIQHIGIVLGLKGVTGYPLRGRHGHTQGYLDVSQFIRNCSAVSGACMMVRKNVFEQVGGFAEDLTETCNDIDFCLRVREAGYRIVWTPEAELYHDGPMASDQLEGMQAENFKRRWAKILENDPYYNPNLTIEYEDLGYRV
jgi:GT2 family glycosyltransferase